MKNKKVDWIIIALSVVVATLVSILAKYSVAGVESVPWNVHDQPKLHALLNSITAICITAGYVAIKGKHVRVHRFCMFSALIASAVFLVSYVMYHGLTESTPFGGEGVIRSVYFFILISHIILAALIFPLILMTVHRAITNQLDAHRRLARFTFPIWLYVAVTGVIVYFMISPYYAA